MLKVNEYFDGNVKSIGFEQKAKSYRWCDGSGRVPVQYRRPGAHDGDQGALTIQLADEDEWHTYQQGNPSTWPVTPPSSWK